MTAQPAHPAAALPQGGRCRSWNHTLTVAGLLILMAVLYVRFFTSSAHVTVELTAESPSTFKIYWSDDKRFYSETRTGGVRYKPGRSRHTFYIGDLGRMTRLRIDPADTPGQVTIHCLEIRQNGYQALRYDAADDFGAWKPVGEISATSLEGDSLRVIGSGIDPQLELPVSPRGRLWNLHELLPLILLLALWLAVLLAEPRFGADWAWVPYGLTLALTLAAAMAALSPDNAHPDEVMHVLAAQYYETRWLPPAICAPEILHTYSPYGVSRLHSPEIVYFLAGKFSRLLRVFPFLDDALFGRMRLFNLFLLALLLATALRKPGSRLLLIPILLSAQVWYQFGSFNSDAFGFFMITIGALQLVDPASTLNRFLMAPALRHPRRDAILLGAFLLLILLVKKNYFTFHLFALLALGFCILRQDAALRRRMLLRGGAALLCGACLLAPVLAADRYANGPGRVDKLRLCREATASPAYRESTPAGEQHPTLHFRQRGIPIRELITRFGWGEKMFRSAFGVYGYLSVSARQPYYDIVAALAAVWLLYVAAGGMWRSGWEDRGTAFVLFAVGAILVGVTFRHAWVHDFQTQGRYLLPLVTLTGIWLHRCGERLNRNTLNGLSICLFTVSCYSMLRVGLAGLVG